MFRFGASEMLFAYLLVPALVALAWWAHARKQRDLERLADRRLLERLTATVSRRGQMAKTVLLVCAVALLVTALARPQFGSRVETARREGQDILIALDLSLLDGRRRHGAESTREGQVRDRRSDRPPGRRPYRVDRVRRRRVSCRAR